MLPSSLRASAFRSASLAAVVRCGSAVATPGAATRRPLPLFLSSASAGGSALVARQSTAGTLPAACHAPPFASQLVRRAYSSSSPPPPPGASSTSSSPGSSGPSRMPRVRTLFLLLTLSAALLTTYGLAQFLASFRTWPKEVRVHLRRALKAQNSEEWRRAEEAYRTALALASSLPTSSLGSDAPLKLSGLSIALGSLLESQLQPLSAYRIYFSALEALQLAISASPSAPPPQWRMRAVALSQRLGDLAQLEAVRQELEEQEDKGVPSWAKGRDAAEAHLVWSVEELLRLSLPARRAVDADSLAAPQDAAQAAQSEAEAVQLSELNLPTWITPTDLGASLEALGSLYAARHEAELAAPLFLHALSILLPPPAPSTSISSSGSGSGTGTGSGTSSAAASKRAPPTAAERCQAAVLMSNLSLVYLSAASQTTSKSAADAARTHAREWAERGLTLTQETSKAAGWTTQEKRGSVVESSEERTREVRGQCVAAEITLLYNLGCMAETAGDKCAARSYLQRAYRRAEQFGMREARSRCAGALSRLERGG